MIDKKFQYHLINRPISVGCYPDNSFLLKTESWRPKRKVNGFNLKSFGYIEYSEKLSFEDIYKYELIPENKKEYAEYMFWEKNDKDIKKANKIKEMYMKLTLEELEKYPQDPFTHYTILLKSGDD